MNFVIVLLTVYLVVWQPILLVVGWYGYRIAAHRQARRGDMCPVCLAPTGPQGYNEVDP